MKTKEERLLKWLLSEDWVIADSHTHVAIDIVEIQRSFVAHFPDAPVPDSGDVEGLKKKITSEGDMPEHDAGRIWVSTVHEIIDAHFAANQDPAPDSGESKTIIGGGDLVGEIRRACINEWRTGLDGKDATDKVIEVAIEIIEAHLSKAVPDSGDENEIEKCYECGAEMDEYVETKDGIPRTVFKCDDCGIEVSLLPPVPASEAAAEFKPEDDA